MLMQVIFLLEEPAYPVKELRMRLDALSRNLITFSSRDVRGIENSALLTSLKDAENAYREIRTRTDTDTTLFATNIPSLAATICEDGAYCIGLIEGAATEDDFPGVRFLFAEFDEVEPDSYVKAYQRLANEPWTILESERCILRETTVADVEAFYNIYKEPAITEYMEGLFEDPEDEKRYTADYIDKVYALMGYGVWTVIDKASGEVIGRAGFSLRGGFAEPEIGFLIAVPYQRKGYATEVINACLKYGKEMLFFETVQALVKDNNTESIHLLKKCGFMPEKEVSIEENIYGNDYTGERVVGLSEIKYGSYLLMKKRL